MASKALADSRHPDEMASFAVALLQQGKAQDALRLLQEGLAQYPGHCLLQHNLAELYRNMGKAAQAEALFLGLIQAYPHFVPSYHSLALILKPRLADPQLPAPARLAMAERLATYLSNMGNALLDGGQHESARDAYREALQYCPDHASALSNLSNVLRQMGQVTEAEALARRALALRPDFAEAWNNLGNALAEQGKLQEAANCYQRALDANPALAEARHNAGSGSLFMQLYRDDIATADIVAAHRTWGEAYPAPASSYTPPDTDGPRRIGFISGDFRGHAMMQFVIPVLEKLDRRRFEIFCYANQTMGDDVTQAIKSLPVTWRDTEALDDMALCDLLAADGLHLLIDLSGHTRGNRLYALARKPVPVMAHWLGYMFTSGLPAFDYRITDPWTDPAASFAARHTEQPAYLQHSQFIYRPKEATPAVNELPALRRGYMTFGSLNNLQKLNRSVVHAWSHLLLSVPESRLLLQSKLLADQGAAGRIRGLFEAYGVDVSRLEFRPFAANYLETYHAIDIALDPFPYNGGTTSCDALWMGVPVLTLAGDRSVGRMGVSILTALGMEAWVADSVEDYVQRGAQHAASPEALATLRSTLRSRFEQSSLRDEAGFAGDFARLLETLIQTPRPAKQ